MSKKQSPRAPKAPAGYADQLVGAALKEAAPYVDVNAPAAPERSFDSLSDEEKQAVSEAAKQAHAEWEDRLEEVRRSLPVPKPKSIEEMEAEVFWLRQQNRHEATVPLVQQIAMLKDHARRQESNRTAGRPVTELLRLDVIRLDGGTQMRAKLDTSVILEYAQAMEDGASFPPISVCYDGEAYWVWDGFHRFRAAEHLGAKDIRAEVRPGTRRDAILLAAGANPSHGLPRSNEDKRRSVLALLRDEEWGKWSDREIARRAAVSNRFVSNLRADLAELSVNDTQMPPEERTVERGGVIYTMNTAAIGTAEPRSDVAAPSAATEGEAPEAVWQRTSVQLSQTLRENGVDMVSNLNLVGNLLRTYGVDRCRQQLEWFPLRPDPKSGTRGELLERSIRGNHVAPKMRDGAAEMASEEQELAEVAQLGARARVAKARFELEAAAREYHRVRGDREIDEIEEETFSAAIDALERAAVAFVLAEEDAADGEGGQ